jgi:NAD(P)-dependent dehydrogenase (short-subunit alcohol dehydrogenase family)
VAELGQLDVLINNASIFEYDNLQTATPSGWDRHMSSNLEAPFILTQAFAAQAPDTASDGETLAQAAIVNMVDQRVRKFTPEFMTYSLAKNALWTLTQTSAQALAPKIRVNAIGPGPTLQGARQSLEHFQGQRGATILKRGANIDDILGAMRYFLDASAVTGQLICVDGGQHLGWKTPDVRGIE